MVELQLQIVRKTCNQNLGLTILAVKDRNEHAVLVGEVTPRSCSALGGLRAGDILLSASGHALFPNPGLESVVATMRNLPINFSVTVKRESACEDLVSAAVVATCSTGKSSSDSSSSILPKALSGRELREESGISSKQRTNLLCGGSNLTSKDGSYKKALHSIGVSQSVMGSCCPPRLNKEHKGNKTTELFEAMSTPTKNNHDHMIDTSLYDGVDEPNNVQSDAHQLAKSWSATMGINESLFDGDTDSSRNSDDISPNSDSGGCSGGNSDKRSSDSVGVWHSSSDIVNSIPSPAWATIGAANANDTEVLLYALLVLLELNGSPRKIDAFTSTIDHCMEKHQQECRRAQRHQPNCHKSNNKRENDNGSSRFTGAWWSVITDSNGNGYNSASLADAPLSPKVLSILDRALRPVKQVGSAESPLDSDSKGKKDSSKSSIVVAAAATAAAPLERGRGEHAKEATLPVRAQAGASEATGPPSGQESAWHTHVAQLTAAAYAIQAFPGRGGGFRYAPTEKATKIDDTVPGNFAQANTKGDDDAPDIAIVEYQLGWRDLNEYLSYYAAERYLTGGVANRSGPPWARRMSQIPSASNHSPLQLRAHACAARIATLLWEHSDSLWRLLSRGDRFQVLPLWEYYNADAHDTCASLAPILKVPAKHLVAINAWRYPGMKRTSRIRPGSRIDYQPHRDSLDLRFLGSYAYTLAQQVSAYMPRAAAFFGINDVSEHSTVVQDSRGGRETHAETDNSASFYNGRGWVGRQDGLFQDDVAARRHKASRSVLRATHVNAAKDVANGVAQEDSPTRADFLAARQGGRKWRAWELEALQGAVQAFRSRRRRNLDQVAARSGHEGDGTQLDKAEDDHCNDNEQRLPLALACDNTNISATSVALDVRAPCDSNSIEEKSPTTNECFLRFKNLPLKSQKTLADTSSLEYGKRTPNEESNPKVTALMLPGKSFDRQRDGVVPGLANPNQGPRHRLLTAGAILSNKVQSLIENSSTSAAAAAVTDAACSSTSSNVSLSASSSVHDTLKYAHGNTGTSRGAASDLLLPLNDVSDVAYPTKRTWEALAASSHAPSHARAREVWRCMQRSESDVPVNNNGATPIDLTEAQPNRTSKPSQAVSREVSQLPLPSAVLQPLVSSAVDFNANGTCKVWRLTPVTVWPSSKYTTSSSTFQLAPGANFRYNAKRTEEILIGGRCRPVTFYRLSLGAHGMGAPWATSSNEAWVHDLPPFEGKASPLSSPSSSSASAKGPFSAYLADKLVLQTLSEDVNVAEVGGAEWEDFAAAAGLGLEFTGGECQDAWEQLWHDDSAPGFEVYTSQGLKHSSAKCGQTAQKRSRLQGEFIHHYEQEDGEEKEEQSVASWKRYKCPVLGCSKIYLIKRVCAIHSDRKCIKDFQSSTRSSTHTSRKRAALAAAAQEHAPDEGLSRINFCDVCGSNTEEDKLLICENCVTGWSSSEDEEVKPDQLDRYRKQLTQHEKLRCFGSAHTFCIGLQGVPKEDWYCSKCTSTKTHQEKVARSNKRYYNARPTINLQLADCAADLPSGAGDKEIYPTSDADLRNFHIDPQDRALVGKTWIDREDNGAKFTLKSIEWSRVDSQDGVRTPMLIGDYGEVGISGKTYWSDMREIREWIKESANDEEGKVDNTFASKDTRKDNDAVSDSMKYGDDAENCRQNESMHANQGRRKYTRCAVSQAWQEANSVVVCDDSGKVLLECSNQRQCAAYLGICPSTVSCCVSGKTKRVNGYRIFSSRSNNMYPPADDARSSAKLSSSAATNKTHGSPNATEVSRKPHSSRIVPSSRKKAVVLLDDTGRVIEAFSSQHEASLKLGLSPSEVSYAVRGSRLLAKLGSNRLHLELPPGSVYPAADKDNTGLNQHSTSLKDNMGATHIRRAEGAVVDSQLSGATSCAEARNGAKIIEIVDSDATELESEDGESVGKGGESDTTLIDIDHVGDDDSDNDWLNDVIATVKADAERAYHGSSDIMLQRKLSQAVPHPLQDKVDNGNECTEEKTLSDDDHAVRDDVESITTKWSCEQLRREKRRADEAAHATYAVSDSRLRKRHRHEKGQSDKIAQESDLTCERLHKRKAYAEHPFKEAELVKCDEARHPQVSVRLDPQLVADFFNADSKVVGTSVLGIVDSDGTRTQEPSKINRQFLI